MYSFPEPPFRAHACARANIVGSYNTYIIIGITTRFSQRNLSDDHVQTIGNCTLYIIISATTHFG